MLVGYLLISKYLRKITYAARIRYLFLPTELTSNHHQYKSLFLERRKKYSYKELYLGPILLQKNDKLFQKKNEKELKTLKMINKNITKGHYLYRLKIRKNIKLLEKYN